MPQEMKKETIEKFIGQLDGMIAAFGQALVLGGRNKKETEAYELLKDARLKLVEDMENRYGNNWQPGWAKVESEAEQSGTSKENDQVIACAVSQVLQDMPYCVVDKAFLYKKIEIFGERPELSVQGVRWFVEVEVKNLNDETTAAVLCRVWRDPGSSTLQAVRVTVKE